MAMRDVKALLGIKGLWPNRIVVLKDRIELEVKLTLEKPSCSKCEKMSAHIHDQKRIPVRDLSCFGKKTILLVPRRRFKCSKCKFVFTERLPFLGFGNSFTSRYEEYLFKESKGRSHVSVAEREGISDTVVRKVFRRFTEDLDGKNGFILPTSVLGLDEISMRKGHKDFKCIVSDINRGGVVAVLENRLKATVKTYLSELPKDVKDAIKVVSMDMWDGYFFAVQEIFGEEVTIVIDRFHVVKNLNKALTNCRRELQKRYNEKLDGEKFKEIRWLLVRRRKSLDEEEGRKLDEVLGKSPGLKNSYWLKEEFGEIFDEVDSRDIAQKRLNIWKEKARKLKLRNINGFLKTFEHWEEWILNYFSTGKVTNGPVEGMNNKVKLIKRVGYGFQNFSNFRKRILNECGLKNNPKKTLKRGKNYEA